MRMAKELSLKKDTYRHSCTTREIPTSFVVPVEGGQSNLFAWDCFPSTRHDVGQARDDPHLGFRGHCRATKGLARA